MATHRHLQSLRELMQQIPAQNRRAVNAFWGAVRQSLGDLEREIDSLRTQVGQSLPRPATTQSVNVIRDAVDGLLNYESRIAADSSNTVEAIADLPMLWALRLLERKRSIYDRNSIDCWVSTDAPAHGTGYVKVNLRNTTDPTRGGLIGVQPWVHQISIVAKGEGPRLRLTTDGSFQVCDGDSGPLEALTKRSARCLTCAITQDALTRNTC